MIISQRTSQIIQETMNASEQLLGNNIRSTRTVRIGDPVATIIYANVEKTRIYIHSLGDTVQGRSTISAAGIPADILNTYNRIIRVERADDGSERYVGLDTQYDEIFAQGLEESHDQKPVSLSQLDYGIAHAFSGMVLFINGAIYGNDYVTDLVTADFSTGAVQDTDGNNIVIPTTNNRAIAILVQVAPATGILSYKQSSEFLATTSLQQQFINGILPQPDSADYRVCYGRLIKGATAFKSDDIWVVPEFLNKGALWPEPIVEEIEIPSGFQQHAIEQSIASGGILTVAGEYWVDNFLVIEDGGQLIISDGGQMTIRPVITDQPSLIAASREVTSDYTVTLGDGSIMVNTSGGDVTITLMPVAEFAPRSVRIGKANLGGGNVIVDGDGGETINGDLTQTLTQQWTNLIFVGYGTTSVDYGIG